MALHATVGPRHTTVSGIAEHAGVERLTVYRHFPDQTALYAACSQHWAAAHPLPSPARWAAEPSPSGRTRRALAELYRYFRSNQQMLGNALRDLDEVPELRTVTQPFLAALRRYGEDLAHVWPGGAGMRLALLPLLRHAADFTTWRSLEVAGLPDDDAKAAAIVRWLESVAQS